MPCISGAYDPRIGVLLQVGILPGGAVAEAHRQAGAASDGEHPEFRGKGAGTQGLVDTGATMTCVSAQLAQHLALPPRGKIEVQGATGSNPVNAYHVDFMLGFGEHSMLIESLDVCEFDPGQAPFQALIGRDVLCRGVLTMDFSGHFSFSI